MAAASKILFIEDDEDFVYLMIALLGATDLDFEVLRAETREELAEALASRPDMVVSDFHLPGDFGGMEVIEAAQSFDAEIPIVVVTGDERVDPVECIRRGAADCLLKSNVAALPGVLAREALRAETRLARMERERALEREREVLLFAVEAGGAGAWWWDLERNRMTATAKFASLFGFPDQPRDASADIYWDRIHPEDAPAVQEKVARAVAEAGQYEAEFKVALGCGSDRYLRICGKALISDDERLLYGMCHDVTTRVEQTISLHHREEHFRNLFDNAPDALFVTTTRDGIKCNAAAAALMGGDTAQLQGRDPNAFYADPTDRDRLLRATRTSGEIVDYEVRLKRLDGSVIQCLVTARSLLTPDGEIDGLYGSIRDVTASRQEERDRAQAQKLESIGQLAAGIAHEINTPVQYAGDNIRFLTEAFEDMKRLLDATTPMRSGSIAPEALAEERERIASLEAEIDLDFLLEEVPQSLSQALEGVDRVAEIVRAMKRFSHPGVEDKAPTDLNEAIQSTATVSRNEWKYIAELTCELDEDIPLVTCHPGEINQVVLNMIVNAAHAITDVVEEGAKGQITISTGLEGDWALIRIADTGGGMPPHVVDRIFDPFFTTKEVGKGTGQGLAIAHSVIVEKHKGQLSVDTEEGVGTTFTIRLPLGAEPEVQEAAAPEVQGEASPEVQDAAAPPQGGAEARPPEGLQAVAKPGPSDGAVNAHSSPEGGPT